MDTNTNDAPVTAARLRWVLQEVLGSLPERRDWLNPDAEREMLAMLKELNAPVAAAPAVPDVVGLTDVEIREFFNDRGFYVGNLTLEGRPKFYAAVRELLATKAAAVEPVGRGSAVSAFDAWDAWVAKRSHTLDTMHNRNIFYAGYEAAPAAPEQAVPEGWKLVPIEPTEEMDAAARAECHRMQGVIDPVIHVWDAMLAAVPVAPVEADQPHVMPPVAAPVSQLDAGAVVELWRNCGWASNDGNALKFARAIEAEVASRCRAPGGNTSEESGSDLAHVARQAQAAPVAQEGERGWCIEKGSAFDPLYLHASENGILDWTPENAKALRFARRADAESMVSIVEDADRVAEHIWSSAAQAAPSSTEASAQAVPIYQIESTLKDGMHWFDTNEQVYNEHFPEHRRIVYASPAAAQAAPAEQRDAVLEEALEACERVQEKCSERNSGKWPELQESADMGAGECVAAIRALRTDSQKGGS